jgi:hypothetical protein
MKGKALFLILPLLAAMMAGCSKAPVVEENSATQAITMAEQSQASKYAQAEWQMAKDTLEAAKAEKLNQDGKFSLFRSYGTSKGMFERAAVLAAKAESTAKAELLRVKQETETILRQVQTDLDSLAAMMLTLPAGKDTKADIELMKQDVAALQQQLQGAQQDFSRQDYESAKSKAMAVADKAFAMRTSLEAVKAKSGKRRAA